MIRPVPIADLRTDGGTQPRAYTDHATVDDYAEAMKGGAEFPPVIVFSDGAALWLADGFHRVLAAHKLGHETVSADIRKGTVRDAVLFSVGANATHGRPRTNADKRHAVMTLLKDPEWAGWSDSEVARRCSVSVHLVHDVRVATFPKEKLEARKVARTRNGKTAIYSMSVANMGRKPKPRAERGEHPPTLERPTTIDRAEPPKVARPDQAVAEQVWTGLCRLPRGVLVEVHRRLGRLLEMQP